MASTNLGNDDHNKGESRHKISSRVKCISVYIGKPALYHSLHGKASHSIIILLQNFCIIIRRCKSRQALQSTPLAATLPTL